MYTPSSFKENDPSIALQLIRDYNFGLLISNGNPSPLITHLPFMVESSEGKPVKLITHMARANKHWRSIEDGQEVLCVFNGPHTYISPSWYEDRVTVPTWNYATVHVRGSVRHIHDEDRLRKIVTDLTHHMESRVESNWDLSEGEETIPIELKAIVGMDIEIRSCVTKLKFNQNRSVADQQKVINELEKSGLPGAEEMITIMKRNLNRKP
jgi:transcriptional regulator